VDKDYWGEDIHRTTLRSSSSTGTHIMTCSCGWASPVYNSAAEAEADADGHVEAMTR